MHSISKHKSFVGHLNLPLRTQEEFYDEGKQEAYELAKHYDVENDIVLEFGCGVGRILNFVKAKELHGADIKSFLLKEITAPHITTHHYDGSYVLKEKYFDFIYAYRVFQHIDINLIPDILVNLKKSLNENGKMRLQFPQNPNFYFQKTSSQFSNNIRLFTKFEIQEMFDYAQLKYTIEEGNFVGYGLGGKIKPEKNVEYFITATL